MPKTNTMQYVNISIFKKNALVNLCFGNYPNIRNGEYLSNWSYFNVGYIEKFLK